MHILFTSVGRRVALLKAFRAAYASLGLQGRIIAVDIDPLAPAIRLADKPYLVPRLASPEYIPTLIEICRREQVDIIFPLIDPDIPLLGRHRAEIEVTGARLAVVPSDAAAIADDKWLTSQFFRRLKLPAPRSWLPQELDPRTIDYPLFIKPRNGSASKYTFKVRTPEELSFFSSYVPNPIIQEYLPGPEITSDLICDLDGEVLAIVSRQRMEVRSGEVAKGVTVFNRPIHDACVQVAAALPAVGPITVQCIMKDGVPHFTEINARLGGGIPLAIAAGVNVPALLLARLAGIPIRLHGPGEYQTGLYMTRFDESFLLTEEERVATASRRNHQLLLHKRKRPMMQGDDGIRSAARILPDFHLDADDLARYSLP